MDADFKREFAKCPLCGCEERFFEELGKQAVAEGTVSPEFHFAKEAMNGVTQDQKRPLRMGDKPIGWTFETDICMGCGTMYAVKLARLGAEVKSPIYVPGNGHGNRADRRRLEHEKGRLNN